MKIAFYKGTHRLFDKLVQWWTKSAYSHTEVVLEEYEDGWALCGSSSFLDRGVRMKVIHLTPDKWDVINLEGVDAGYAKAWYTVHSGKKYDLLGLLSIVSPIKEHPDKYWCSEANAASLKIEEPFRYSPADLYSYVITTALARRDSK